LVYVIYVDTDAEQVGRITGGADGGRTPKRINAKFIQNGADQEAGAGPVLVGQYQDEV
jgi:hypothetical protein